MDAYFVYAKKKLYIRQQAMLVNLVNTGSDILLSIYLFSYTFILFICSLNSLLTSNFPGLA
jgi:hypothetical protein